MIKKIRFWLDVNGYRRERLEEKALTWIAWRLPRKVVMWAAVRLFAHGTTGPWGDTQPGTLDIFEALNRWDIYPKRSRPKYSLLILAAMLCAWLIRGVIIYATGRHKLRHIPELRRTSACP